MPCRPRRVFTRSWRAAALLLILELACAVAIVLPAHADPAAPPPASTPVSMGAVVQSSANWAVWVFFANFTAAVNAEKARVASLHTSHRTLHTAQYAATGNSGNSVGSYKGFPCGGDLPPCYVLRAENPMGDPTAWNTGCHEPFGWSGPPCGNSTASGLWQILRSTWAKFGGYLNAADAPADVQNDKARILYAGGRGCHQWVTC